MTLERLLSFYRRSNQPRYTARISRPIITRRVGTRPERVLKRTTSLQAPPDTWQSAQNVNLMFNRAASLQQGEVRVSTLKSESLRQSKNDILTSKTVSGLRSRLGKTRELCLHSNKAASLQWSESRVYTRCSCLFYFRWGSCSQGNTTFASTRYVFSLCFYDQLTVHW